MLFVGGDGKAEFSPKSAQVTAQVVQDVLGDKIRIGKYKPKSGLRRHGPPQQADGGRDHGHQPQGSGQGEGRGEARGGKEGSGEAQGGAKKPAAKKAPAKTKEDE